MIHLIRTACLSLVVLSVAGTAAAQTRPAPLEHLRLFVGPDGSKQPQDLGINAHMGVRLDAAWSGAVIDRLGIGVQAGVGLNVSDAAVHVLDQIGGPSSRRQVFVTLGLFQRTARGLEWGVAYDALHQRYGGTSHLAQARLQIGYALRAEDQIGVTWRTGLRGDDQVVLDTPVRLDPIAQGTVYHRHTWARGAQTTVWIGAAGGHDNVVFVFPDDTRDDNVLVYGAALFMPLSDRFAIVGASNLVTPAATGTVDAFLGVTWFPGRGAERAATARFAPVFPVANNPDFSVNLRR